MVVEIVFSQDPKDAGTFLLLLPADGPCLAGRPTPKLSYFSRVGIGFEFVGSILEDLIELAWPNAHIILLYNASHNCLHLLLLFYEFHHEMKNVGADVPAELLLGLASHPFVRALRAHLGANSAAQTTSLPRNNFLLDLWGFQDQRLGEELVIVFWGRLLEGITGGMEEVLRKNEELILREIADLVAHRR